MHHQVSFLPSRGAPRRVRVASGTSLLDAARQAGLPVASACGGEALCGRCGMDVLDGARWLSPETHAECFAKRRNRTQAGLRLACRTPVRGDLGVTTPYW